MHRYELIKFTQVTLAETSGPFDLLIEALI